MALTVEMWPIDKPVPYTRNPRRISEAAIDKVAASLDKFGWRQPIVVDRDGVIVVGHTRLLAARKLGLEEVAVHVAADLSPKDAKAYRLADNRTGEEAEWNASLLGLELADLREMGADLQILGFDEDELVRYEPERDDTPPDDFAEYGEDIETEHQCPSCGYRWSGDSRAKNITRNITDDDVEEAAE